MMGLVYLQQWPEGNGMVKIPFEAHQREPLSNATQHPDYHK